MLRDALALSALLAATAVGLAGAWTPCTCGEEVLDCSYRNLTVLLDVKTCFASAWDLRGNDLRKLPDAVPYSVLRLDLSNAGLVGNVNLQDMRVEYRTPYTGRAYEGVKYLDISFNHIKSLNFTSVYNEGMVSFNASNNLIEHLEIRPPEYGGVRLEIFRMSNNRITKVPSGLSAVFFRLQYLDLSGNPLQVVSVNAFEKLYNLQVLRIDETRELSTLLNGTFSDVVNLQYLYLSGNALESLPSGLFENLKKLQVLELQRNSLQRLPDDLFRNLFSLRLLNLDDNRLEHLQDVLFAGLHSLEDLSVRSNQLTAVPSVHLCWGPLQTALFNDNLIQKVSEKAVRSLLRHGFRFGDLRGNSIPDEALEWIKNTSDVRIKSPRSYISLWVENHGKIAL